MEGIVINAGAQNTLNPNMIAQESGNSPYLLMSQKAITNLMSRLSMSSPRILNAPIFIEDLVYNGEEITPAFYGYDDELMEIGGQTSAADAGVYTATFTPKDDCMWTDGTQRTIECTWKIGKAAGFCEAATHTVRLKEGTSFDIPFSHYEGAQIKVTTSNEPTATATVSGGTITVTAGHVRGTAKITVESVESDNWTSAKAEIDVTCLEMLYVPAQNGTLTYNGAEQAPTWSNAADSAYTKKGVESATNAGTYITEFTPKTGYCWIDGTEKTKEVSWTIQKAEGTLTVVGTTTPSAMNLGVGYMNAPAYRTVQWNTGSSLSIVSRDTAIATARYRADGSVGPRASVAPVKKGSTIVEVSADSTNNYTTPKPVSIIVNSNIPSSTLSECTWAEIRSATNAGVADKLWQVGDLSPFVHFQGPMAGKEWNVDFNFRIVNLTPSLITMMLAQNRDGVEIALGDGYHSDISAGSAGICINRSGDPWVNHGYNDSYMCQTIMIQFDAGLPRDLYNSARWSYVWADNVGYTVDGAEPKAESVTQNRYACWLPAILEICGYQSGNCNPAMSDHVSQFQWYADGNFPTSYVLLPDGTFYMVDSQPREAALWTRDPRYTSYHWQIIREALYGARTLYGMPPQRTYPIKPCFTI